MKRVAILISGSGSNMEALINNMVGNHPARPVIVISNKPTAAGLNKARSKGVPTAIVDHTLFDTREDFETALHAQLEPLKPDILALAGFMRILSPQFISLWRGRILNIHPSLLPKYPGLHTHEKAIAAKDTEAGCTVHEVTEDLDAGPILGQARVPILPNDTKDTLAKRALEAEHMLYPAVLNRFATGNKELIEFP